MSMELTMAPEELARIKDAVAKMEEDRRIILPQCVTDWLLDDPDRSVKISASPSHQSLTIDLIQDEPNGSAEQARGVEMNITVEALPLMDNTIMWNYQMKHELAKLGPKSNILIVESPRDCEHAKIGDVVVCARPIAPHHVYEKLRVPVAGDNMVCMEFEAVKVKHPVSNEGWRRIR